MPRSHLRNALLARLFVVYSRHLRLRGGGAYLGGFTPLIIPQEIPTESNQHLFDSVSRKGSSQAACKDIKHLYVSLCFRLLYSWFAM